MQVSACRSHVPGPGPVQAAGGATPQPVPSRHTTAEVPSAWRGRPRRAARGAPGPAQTQTRRSGTRDESRGVWSRRVVARAAAGGAGDERRARICKKSRQRSVKYRSSAAGSARGTARHARASRPQRVHTQELEQKTVLVHMSTRPTQDTKGPITTRILFMHDTERLTSSSP